MVFITDNDSKETSEKVKISLKNVFKVFGDRPERALKELKSGKSKTDIHRETGCTIGVDDAGFEIMEG